MRPIDYLPTHVFELVIHGMDLAAAIGVKDEPPRAPLAVTLRLLANLAVESGKARAFTLGVTGRTALPEGQPRQIPKS